MNNIKELILYVLIVVMLLTISILYNIFWKIGKEETAHNEITNLKSGNIIYNVPFKKQWLD